MSKRGYTVYGYVDDVLGISPQNTAMEAYEYLLELLKVLNFPVSVSKLVPPTTKCNCLGLMVDTVAQTISIPEGKEIEILEKCKDFITHKYVTKRKLQSLVGSIMYIHKCVKSSRFFTNRLLEALRSCNGNFVNVTDSIKQDVKWLIHFIPQFNGYSKYVKAPIKFMHTTAIDACLTGVGGVWGNEIYTAQLPREWVGNNNYNINHFEMVNILVAIRLWGEQWSHQHVRLYVDNASVVQVCNSGYTRDSFLAQCIRNIWLHTSVWDICLEVHHIPGYRNKTADLLSRWQNNHSCNHSLNELISNPVWCNVQPSLFQLNEQI